MAQAEKVEMPAYRRAGAIGALLLALSIAGYAVYELILRPQAGFPSDYMAVILGGIDTLRVGHWLKFGYAASLALLTVGLRARLAMGSPAGMGLAVLAGLLMLIGAGAILWSGAPGLASRIGLAFGTDQTPLRFVRGPVERRELENGSELFAVSGQVINPTGGEQRVGHLRHRRVHRQHQRRGFRI